MGVIAFMGFSALCALLATPPTKNAVVTA